MILLDIVFTSPIEQSPSFIETLTKPEIIIAISAIVVSIVSLVGSILYNRINLKNTIKHNKLSVEPLIDFVIDAKEIKKAISLTIQNTGLGPGIITKLKYTYNSGEFDKMSDILNRFNPKILNKLIRPKSEEIKFLTNHSLAPNDKLVLFAYFFETDTDYKVIENIIQNTRIEIEYETIYGKNKKLESIILEERKFA
jgi:hypothetical protein